MSITFTRALLAVALMGTAAAGPATCYHVRTCVVEHVLSHPLHPSLAPPWILPRLATCWVTPGKPGWANDIIAFPTSV